MSQSKLEFSDRVRAHSKATGYGILEAKLAVEREDLLQSIDKCATFYELKQIVRTLAERTRLIHTG